MELHGFCDDAFTRVRDVFLKFEDGLAGGAAVASTKDGKPVVDLWAGEAGPNDPPWAMFDVFSAQTSQEPAAWSRRRRS